jgi:organic radical activating enzyme
MFDVDNFYQECGSGEIVDCTEVYQYLRSFKNLILWGGSYLGTAVGRKLLSEGFHITKYWDVRCDELKMVNGIAVEKPFASEYDREDTLVVYCIGNHTIMWALTNEMKCRGYQYLRGDIFYSGAICKFKNGMSLTSEQCWGSMECRPLVCKRATSIIQSRNQEKKPGDRIDFTYIAFIVNSVCNLSCKYCFQYINNYPSDKKYNVPLDILCRDADVFMDTIDSTGSITVMGGETFLHPQLGEFIQHLCTHKNFGFISVASNGLVPISERQLEGMSDKRVSVNFGSYLHVATEQEKETYYKNVELVKSYGITCTESIKLPRWTVPPTLYKLDVDEQYKIDRKTKCVMPPRDLQIKNGKVHVCDMSLALHNMGLQDYPTDYMDLTVPRSLEENRNELRRLLNEPYYESCGHCNSCGKDAGEGGTQGKWNVFSPE